jgi:predicted enzyme related to lactoylglutathione lyase
VFDANGTMLRVTAVSTLTPQPFTVLGWAVPDIDAKARELAAAGIQLDRFDGLDQDESGIWTAPDGDRVAWFQDPDGNRLSIAQFG